MVFSDSRDESADGIGLFYTQKAPAQSEQPLFVLEFLPQLFADNYLYTGIF